MQETLLFACNATRLPLLLIFIVAAPNAGVKNGAELNFKFTGWQGRSGSFAGAGSH